jgi:hypothetical protein
MDSDTRGEQFSMVDQESATYRPRRAFIEPDAEAAQPERPAQPDRNGTRTDRNGTATDRTGIRIDHNGSGTDRNGIGTDRNGSGPYSNGIGPTRPAVIDDDYPKPLYRDYSQQNGSSLPAASRAAPRQESDPPTEETMSPIAFAPRRPRVKDDETTTILPRSRPTKHRTQALDAIDDYDDDQPTALGGRAKLALIIGAVAAVVVIGLVIGYSILSVGDQPQSQPSVSPPAGGSGASGGASQAAGQAGGGAVLTDGSMLSVSQAKALAPNRKWRVVTTQRGAKPDGPTAACFGAEPPEGRPAPQQEIVRVLEGSGGKSGPKALHNATAYSSPAEASQAYVIASKTVGSCAVAGFYIESGRSISKVGDQALGVVVMEVDGKKKQAHSVVVNRTGRVMNVIDAVQPSRAIAIDAVAKALEQVNRVQCGGAGGPCDGRAAVTKGPPPIGGDEPGFLTVGDLPPAGPKVELWVATQVELPKDEFQGSQCEGVNWVTEKAKSRTSRVYLLPESGKNFFGLNEVVLTMNNPKAARKLVDRIKSKLSTCKTIKLTASVTKPKKVKSMGAQKTVVKGWTTVVSQKSTQGTAKYRVGIVAAGSKVAYTFLNPRGDYDFSNRQWNTVAVRAGERATQVNE